MKKVFKTMAFTLLGLVLSSNLMAASATYTKVTASPDDWSGDYILVYEVDGAARVFTGVDAASDFVDATISNNTITGEFVTLTLGTTDGGYLVKINGGDNDGKYISSSTNANGLAFGISGAVMTISYDESVLMTNAGGAVMRYNNTSGQDRFRFYKATSYTSQQAVQLYKKKAADPTFTITAQSNNTDYGTVSLSGSVITASPKEGYRYANPAYTVSPDGSATVAQSGNEFTVTPSANTTVTINFTAIPKHTVTWSVSGETTIEQVAEGAAINFENASVPTVCGDKVFRGWVSQPIVGVAETEPTYVTSATMGTQDITYYAVFADEIAAVGASGSTEVTPDGLSLGSSYADLTTATGDYGWKGTQIYKNGGIQGNSNKSSCLWNTTIFPNSISKIEIKIGTAAGANSTASIFFGSSAKPTSGNEIKMGKDTEYALSTKDNKITLTDIPEGSTYMNLVWTSDASYYASIKIYYGGNKSYSNFVTTCAAPAGYKVTLNPSTGGTISADKTLGLAENDEVTLSYDLTDGYSFVEWTVLDGDAGEVTVTNNKFNMPASDVEVEATFAPIAVESVTLNKTELSLETGESETLTATIVPDNALVKDLTWESSNTGVAEVDATGKVTAKAAGTANITATSNNSKVGTCVVTVTEHVVTPGTYEIALNKDLYGITTAGNVAKEQSVTTHDITVVSGCASDATSKTYYDAAHIRYYAKSYLKLSVPAGYEITSVVFTEPSSGKNWSGSITSTPDAYNADTKTWTGKSQNVDFAFGAQNRAASITVTFAEKKVVSGIAVKTAPTKTTYYVGDEFDPAGLVITASYASGDPEDIAYTEDNKDAFSFSGFNSEAEATGQVITVTYAEKSATFSINIETERTLNSITVASNPTKMVYEVGEALDLTGLVVNGIFSKGDPEAVEYTASPANGAILDAVGNTTVTLTSVDNTELTTSFDVTVNAIEGDRLTLASTGVSGSSYVEWSGKTGSEGVAVYAGKSAGGNSSIQLNTSNPQGIVSTTSGGLIRKVKVDWNSSTSTTGNRSIDIYGSNTAYTGSGDIYNNEKQGTKLGSIVCGTSTELEISGDYEYVGVRAIGGALYMNSITFVWSAPKVLEGIAVKTVPTVVDYAAGEFFNPAGLVITATYDDETTADIVYEGNEDKFSFSPALDAALATTDEKVTITYGGKSCDQTITVKNIELTSIVVSGDLTKTEYTEGDDFDFTGLVATGYYSDETNKGITDQVVWSIDPATLTAGQTSVSVIATSGLISGNKSYDITVNAAPLEVTWDASQQEYSNEQAVTEAEFNAIISAEFEGGKYYTSGTAVRVYGGKTFAIHAASGYKITSIVIGFGTGDGSNTITADGGTYSSGTWTGSAKDVTFTVDGTSGHRRLKTFTVTYAVAAPSAATPTITPSTEAEIYWEPITVTLATTTEGAAIYYTTNGDAPTIDPEHAYSEPFQVSATTTIKAIAVKDGLDNSEVASKIFNFGPVYANLVDLVNAGEPTTTGEIVKVTLTNEEIAAFDGTQGIYIDVPTDPVKRIEVYCKNRPEAWVVGGTVSGTLQCTWKKYSSTWELCPTSWDDLNYTAPAGTTEVVLTGTPTKNVYVDGEAFDPAGITVTATINGVPTVVTEGITWSVETLTLGTTSIDITATYNEVVSNTIENFAVTVNAIQQSTIADFISNEGGRCYLIGTVSDFNSSNKRFNLTDATGTLYIYSHSLATGITEVANDDYIKVLAETYNTTYENAENVVVVEKLVKPQVDVTGISLNKSEATITIGKTETLVATIEPLDASDKEVIWTSSNEAVATVAGGVVTAKVAGSAVITAKSHENEEITATCTVTVVAAQVKYFALATSTADLDAAVTNGKKVVIAPATSETDEVVMGTYASGNNIKAIEADYADERIALEVGEDAFYTIAKDGDYYTFQDGNSKYIYAAGGTGSNYLKADETLNDKGRWNVSITDNVASIVCKEAATTRNTMQFNPNNDNPMFACYSSASQKNVALYVEAEKPAYVPVESIELNETSAEVMVGKKLTLTATVGPDNATQKGVNWTSNNEKVTVENGLVVVDAEAEVGTTATITATTVGTQTEGGDDHLTATCTITVIALTGTKYGLVSNINTLYDGAVVVLGAVYEKNSEVKYAVSGAIGTGKYMASVDVAAADYTDETMFTAGAAEITLHKVEGGWTMTSDEGNIYLSGADIKVSTTQDATVWTISIENGEATIKSGTGTTQIEYNSTDPRFKMYSGQKSIGIYMKNLVAVRNGLTAGKIGTICYPQAIAAVDGANLYQPNYKDDAVKNIYFSTPDEYKAGLPMIFQADREIMKVVFTGDEAPLIEDLDVTRGMVGNLGDTYEVPQNMYIFTQNKLWIVDTGCFVDKNRAYVDLNYVPYSNGKLPLELPSGAPRKTISLDNASASTPTNFNGLNGNMKAQKVMKDGQFYIIREAKMYNAQGIEVQ